MTDKKYLFSSLPIDERQDQAARSEACERVTVMKMTGIQVKHLLFCLCTGSVFPD